MAFYLSFKELMHNRGRFLLIASIVALITTLVLFIAALAEGLGDGNREYLEKLNGELIVYQDNADFSISASRLGRSTLAEVRRVDGIADAGQINFSATTLEFANGSEPLDVSLLGVEAGKPGEPPALEGTGLSRDRANEAVLDRNVAERSGVQVGDTIVVVSNQGTDEERYPLTVVGISDGRQYSLQPSIFVPLLTWDKIRPQAGDSQSSNDLVSNVIVVRLENPGDVELMKVRLPANVSGIEVADRRTAYEFDARLLGPAEHAQHPALLHAADRRAGYRRLLPDPDLAEDRADRHVEGYRHHQRHRRTGRRDADRDGQHRWRHHRRRRVAAAFADLPGRGADRVHVTGSDPGRAVAVDHRAAGRAGVGLGADES